jgi:hypothetical protein
MRSPLATRSRLAVVVNNWLGLDWHDTDIVLEVMNDLATQQKIDLEEASIEQVRKLADEAFEYCEEERWFKDH